MRVKHLAVFALPVLLVSTLRAAAPDTALVDAIKRSDLPAARALVQKKADVNAPTIDGSTALHWAVQKDALDLVDLLIGAGANIKAENRYHVTPLSLACTNGNFAIVERLLKAGADPNTALPGGETVLMTAARTGKPEVIKALVAYGANPNAKESSRGQTALMWAAGEGNVAALKVLVEAGADINARTAAAAGAAPAAGRGGRPGANGGGVFTGAVGGAEPMAAAAGRPSFTALLFAVQLGKLESVRALVDSGASVNDGLPDGTSALVLATQNGNWELGSYLIDKGADVNAAKQGFNALHQISRIRRTNIGFTPPPVGTGTISSLDLAKKLIASHVEINARMTRDFRDGYRNRLNRVGATAFLLASKNVDTELMKLLLAGGADPKLANADRTTPLMVAAGVDLWNPGEDGGTTPENEPEALEAVKMLVALGNDVNAANDRGETALHGAAYRGANTIVQYLVDQGAKLDARSQQGWTPWTIANGVFYSLFFKEQRSTADYLAKLMTDRGISTKGMEDNGRTCFDCGRNNRVLRDANGARVAQPTPDSVPRTDEDEKATETKPKQ
jgi:ankyrin repeat protein